MQGLETTATLMRYEPCPWTFVIYVDDRGASSHKAYYGIVVHFALDRGGSQP